MSTPPPPFPGLKQLFLSYAQTFLSLHSKTRQAVSQQDKRNVRDIRACIQSIKIKVSSHGLYYPHISSPASCLAKLCQSFCPLLYLQVKEELKGQHESNGCNYKHLHGPLTLNHTYSITFYAVIFVKCFSFHCRWARNNYKGRNSRPAKREKQQHCQ